ncbi:Twin-arginine translocation pathway signal precursor [Bosea sp. LC85]|uniref:Bug family tripartite tricarboxylate transporter substrate binding protein n=1 Tax=Bosea sp. LC85 TaxID=1502851 RepID=UPI0004E2EA4B|nr:tripartite tricarboxylate transporter substrate binding protein [Bosea sp. LC85]KFC70363.1 Twin-arginine translocation pathway signal precursor [Bosea sp. LC85]
MSLYSRRAFAASLVGLGALASTRGALGQSWPARPVTIIVPFPAGAATDVVARLLAERLRAELGQGFVVENKPGAGGNLAAANVVRATPDGHTLFVSSSGPLVTNKLLYKTLSFDPLVDFEPIAMIGDVQVVVATHPSLPVKTLSELIAYGKANPGKLTFGSPGFGLMGHIAGELIQRKGGFQMTHVPYRGSAPLATDLLAGIVNVAVDFLPPYIPHVKSGAVRALAVTAEERAPQLPDVPTLSEAGLTGVNASSWYAIVGPKGLPEPISRRIGTIVNDYVLSPEGRAKLNPIGVRSLGGGPDVVRKSQAQEIAKWSEVIRTAAIALD